MKPEEIEARIKTLENQVKVLQDIEDIKKLQRAYGFYLEHWMAAEIIDLFADGPDTALEWPEGKYIGKASVIRYFEQGEIKDPEFIHQLMQLSPVVDIDPDGKTAKGRWYCFGGVAMPRGKGVSQSFMNGIYENDYVKENGKWKIKRFHWHLNYSAKPSTGFIKPERAAAADPNAKFNGPAPDIPDTRMELQYPSGHIFPFHYTHPVTGKKTTEKERNDKLNKLKK
jgi:hypothetical protein